MANYNIPVSQLLVSSNQLLEYNVQSDFPLYSLAEITQTKTNTNTSAVYKYENIEEQQPLVSYYLIEIGLFIQRVWFIQKNILIVTLLMLNRIAPI